MPTHHSSVALFPRCVVWYGMNVAFSPTLPFYFSPLRIGTLFFCCHFRWLRHIFASMSLFMHTRDRSHAHTRQKPATLVSFYKTWESTIRNHDRMTQLFHAAVHLHALSNSIMIDPWLVIDLYWSRSSLMKCNRHENGLQYEKTVSFYIRGHTYQEAKT